MSGEVLIARANSRSRSAASARASLSASIQPGGDTGAAQDPERSGLLARIGVVDRGKWLALVREIVEGTGVPRLADLALDQALPAAQRFVHRLPGRAAGWRRAASGPLLPVHDRTISRRSRSSTEGQVVAAHGTPAIEAVGRAKVGHTVREYALPVATGRRGLQLGLAPPTWSDCPGPGWTISDGHEASCRTPGWHT